MKANFTKMIIIGCFSVMILVSCESHEQKADDAFELVKEEKMLSINSVGTSKEIIQEPKGTKLVEKNENQDEWETFKMETGKKILRNGNKIKEIKGIPNSDAKLFRKVTSLEKDNNDLRRQMDEYNEEVKLSFEKFKTMINHDVNEIGIELKDLAIINKK